MNAEEFAIRDQRIRSLESEATLARNDVMVVQEEAARERARCNELDLQLS